MDTLLTGINNFEPGTSVDMFLSPENCLLFDHQGQRVSVPKINVNMAEIGLSEIRHTMKLIKG